MANYISATVTQSSHDGYQAFSARYNASGVNFTTGRISPFIGPHYQESLTYAAFYILKLDNIPQGSTINECKLEVHTNNGYTGGLSNHIYVAVENNLDPAGSGAVVNGALGTMPWQRLGRQAAATTLFGNRCGPTHFKPGETLSSYGAHVRDPSALIYKAFCTDQSDKDALGRTLPAASWVQSEDFSPALQALVDDPDWNSTSQYVMVYLFADRQTGNEFNVGSLADFAWDNGTVGATGWGNGSGQIDFYDYDVGQFAPKLNVTFTSSSLASEDSYSRSAGNVRLTPARILGRWHGVRPELNVGNPFVPKMVSGSGDLPPTGMNAYNPGDPLWQQGNPSGARVKVEGRRPGRVDGSSLYLEDHALTPNNPQIWWDIDFYQKDYQSRDVYSLRLYHRFVEEGWLNARHDVVRFFMDDTYVFSIYHRGKYDAGAFEIREGELGIHWSGQSSSVRGTHRFMPASSGGYYRYEIQVNENFDPKVRVRVYLNDSTDPIETLTANPPDVKMNRVAMGDFGTASPQPFRSMYIADVEIWSDYLLNRQYPDSLSNTVGTAYMPQKWAWFNYDGDEIHALEDLGTVSAISPDGSNVVMTTPTNALTYEDYRAEMWPGDTPAYTLHSSLPYGPGSRRRLDLYIPNGTPPPGGWPVVVYTHGGFWVAGSKESISPQFVTNCCIKGYAVASCNYVLTAMMLYGMGDVPAWDPSADTGRYPSFIINYKEAAHWLKTKSSVASGGDGTYNINASKMIASGHSAGGYNALAAAVSRGLTDDGKGRNLTLAGNVETFGSPNVPDPEFLGVYSFAAPVSLNLLKAWDPTVPDWTVYGTGDGLMTVTARMFMGNNAYSGDANTDNVGVDDMILRNAPNVPSICYTWGTSDLLVVNDSFTEHSQVRHLEQIINSVSGLLPPTTTFESHEVPDALHHTIQDIDMDYQHFFRWASRLPGINP